MLIFKVIGLSSMRDRTISERMKEMAEIAHPQLRKELMFEAKRSDSFKSILDIFAPGRVAWARRKDISAQYP